MSTIIDNGFMIIHNILQHLFSAPSVIAIIRELDLRVKGLTGREIAKLAKLTPQAAHNTLTNLEAFKIVKRDFAGRSHYFYLNRDIFLYKNIISPMLKAEKQYKENIFKEIVNALGSSSDSIILFGSVARREETAESDIDICIVYTGSRTLIEKIVSDLRDTLYSKYGISLGPFYIKKSEFLRRIIKNKPPVNDILKDGIVLSGLSINELRNG